MVQKEFDKISKRKNKLDNQQKDMSMFHVIIVPHNEKQPNLS